MSELNTNEKEEYYRKSRDAKLYFYHVKNNLDKPWDYEYLFQKNIYPGLGKEKQLVEKWLSFFPVEKLNFSALSQHHYISGKWFDQFPNAPWVIEKLSRNKKFKFSMFLKSKACVSRTWDWSDIIFSPGDVSLDNFKRLLDCNWNIKNYLNYPITQDWFDYIPDSPEIYALLSKNKNLDISWLQAKPYAPWQVSDLVKHKACEVKWLLIVKSDDWPFKTLSSKRNLSLEILQTYPDAGWDFGIISKNVNLQTSWIKAFPDAAWDFTLIGIYMCLDFEWAELFPEAPWRFYDITANIKEYHKWITKYPKVNWDYKLVLVQPDLTLELLKIIPEEKLNFKRLSSNSALTLEWLAHFPNKPWNYGFLSRHNNFTVEWIDRFPEFPWCFNSRNCSDMRNDSYKLPRLGVCESKYRFSPHSASITYIRKGQITINRFYLSKFQLSWFEKYPDMDWDYSEISRRFSLNLKFLETFKDKPWDFANLSCNPHLTLDIPLAFPEEKWDFRQLAFHQNLTLEWIKRFPKDKWDYQELSNNDNFTLDWFLECPEANWDLDRILELSNTFKHISIYQYYHPEEQVLNILPILITHQFLDSTIPLILLNHANLMYLKNNTDLDVDGRKLICQMGYLLEKDLTQEEKWNIIRLWNLDYDFTDFYPDVIYNMDAPLHLEDLSGDTFTVEGWLESDDIISLIHHNHPDLQGSKFVVPVEDADDDFTASTELNKEFKDKLLKNRKGPFAIIFYPEVEE